MAVKNRLIAYLGRRVAPPRFIAFLTALLGTGVALHLRGFSLPHAFVLAFDVAAALFLLLILPLLKSGAPHDLRSHAADNDANRGTMLVITSLVMLAILIALVALLPNAQTLWHKWLIIGTLALAWLFSNSIFALHYAHLYYREDGFGEGGLGFPGNSAPDYGDFVYFAFTLGMTFQTSDISIETSALRRIVVVHSLAAFVFNLGVLAFTINALGSR